METTHSLYLNYLMINGITYYISHRQRGSSSNRNALEIYSVYRYCTSTNFKSVKWECVSVIRPAADATDIVSIMKCMNIISKRLYVLNDASMLRKNVDWLWPRMRHSHVHDWVYCEYRTRYMTRCIWINWQCIFSKLVCNNRHCLQIRL